jgi:hypothetical protein
VLQQEKKKDAHFVSKNATHRTEAQLKIKMFLLTPDKNKNEAKKCVNCHILQELVFL